jgi:hypothetical protein
VQQLRDLLKALYEGLQASDAEDEEQGSEEASAAA